MAEVAFFDSNAAVGRFVWRTPGAPCDPESLLAEMDLCRISRALVYHATAKDLDQVRGNDLLLDLVARSPRLVPAAVIAPSPDDRGGAGFVDYLQDLVERGVRAFRVFPTYHQLDFADPQLRQGFGFLQERQLPLWVDYDAFYYNFNQLGQHEQRRIELDALDRLAADFPGLPVVIVGANYNHQGKLLSLLERRPNLKIETSLFQGFEMIGRFCARLGAEKLLFGTGLPLVSPGAARACLMYAEIGESEKRKIASGNLEELLGEKKTPSLPEQPGRSEVLLAVDSGSPVKSLRFLDCHGHVGAEGLESVIGLFLGPQDAASIVRAMDRVGTKTVAVSSWQIDGGYAPEGNRCALEAAERFPGRFLCYAVVNPNYPEDWPLLERQITRENPYFGFKPYPFSQRRALSDPAFANMLSLADRMRLPLLCHFGHEPLAGVTYEEISVLAPRYPGAVFIIAHSGASYRTADKCIALAREFGNVYLEINFTSVPFGMISYLVRQAGEERVLFGSDIPMRDPAPILGWVAYDRLSEQAMAGIMGENLVSLVRSLGHGHLLGAL